MKEMQKNTAHTGVVGKRHMNDMKALIEIATPLDRSHGIWLT